MCHDSEELEKLKKAKQSAASEGAKQITALKNKNQELVQELDIHQVTRSVPGFQTLELPREHVSLAHFRWFITFVCIVCRLIHSCPRNWEKGKVFPGLDEEHEEDQNLFQNITPRLLDRVDKVIMATTHAYG